MSDHCQAGWEFRLGLSQVYGSDVPRSQAGCQTEFSLLANLDEPRRRDNLSVDPILHYAAQPISPGRRRKPEEANRIIRFPGMWPI